MYNIVVCCNCGKLLLVKQNQKTRRCPHCDARVNTEQARIVASATTARGASELIRALKSRRES